MRFARLGEAFSSFQVGFAALTATLQVHLTRYGSVECCGSGDHAAESIVAFKLLAPAVGPAAAIRKAFGVDRIAESAGVAASAGRKWHRGQRRQKRQGGKCFRLHRTPP